MGECQEFSFYLSLIPKLIHFKNCLLSDQESQAIFIGFTSWKTNLQTLTQIEEILAFENTSINSGLYYNSTTSSFICPKNGTYLVSVTASASDTQGYNSLWVSVYKGLERILYLYNSGNKDFDNTVSSTVIAQCQAGETLTVKGKGGGGNQPVMKGGVNIP